MCWASSLVGHMNGFFFEFSWHLFFGRVEKVHYLFFHACHPLAVGVTVVGRRFELERGQITTVTKHLVNFCYSLEHEGFLGTQLLLLEKIHTPECYRVLQNAETIFSKGQICRPYLSNLSTSTLFLFQVLQAQPLLNILWTKPWSEMNQWRWIVVPVGIPSLS